MSLQSLSQKLIPALVAQAGIEVEPKCVRAILGDQVAFVTALEQASRWLLEGACETCWVGGVDSYLDPPTIEALSGLRVLRTHDNPTAAMPGEVACFLELQDIERALGIGQRVLARIENFAKVSGATPRFSEDVPKADALNEAMIAAIEGTVVEHVLINLNGDPVRAAEWGHVLVRRTALRVGNNITTWFPPLYFGEIGTGTGPASLALLAQAWARDYAPASRALVCLIGNGSTRAAVRVAAPAGESR
ncbi:MAG: hypothetical protein Q8K82_21885 [Gemmatimonadaceae bacterium]|nr:hypothetical protein [Gemmatimonadaceae bacterium]